ncbi:MAG: GNAT family N-acetyltransferase [Thermoanaerobaculia bacterium]
MTSSTREPRYRVRLATAADASELAAFERDAFRSYYARHRFSEDQFKRYLTRPRTIAYVVTIRGRIIGYVLGILVRTPPVARLLSLAVGSSYRRRGIGHVLLARFIAATRRKGAHAAYLETAIRNTAALTLFRHQGFAPIRRLPDYYAPGVDGIRMRRAVLR